MPCRTKIVLAPIRLCLQPLLTRNSESRPPAQRTGQNAEARAMLAEIYNGFTEGSDTVDLKDAKGRCWSSYELKANGNRKSKL